MTRCDKCGAEAAEGLILCPSCGHKLPELSEAKAPGPTRASELTSEPEPTRAQELTRTQEPRPAETDSIQPPNELPKPAMDSQAVFPNLPWETVSGAMVASDDTETPKGKKKEDKKQKGGKPPKEKKKREKKKKGKKGDERLLEGNRLFGEIPEIIKEKPKKAKKRKSPTVLIIAIVAIFAIAIAAILIMNLDQIACHPDWQCGSWQGCHEGVEIRACADKNNCGVDTGKPEIQRSCVALVSINDTVNETINDTPCVGFGDYCQDDCCEGFCVHNRCWPSDPYCGDGYCDSGETCLTCSHDCGECPSLRELEQNFYIVPLPYDLEQELKGRGYIIISYFYYDACSPCFYPVHIENELRDIAAGMKGLVVIQAINTVRYKTYSDFKGKIMGRVYRPSMIIEGGSKPGKDYLYSRPLSDAVSSGRLKEAVGELICERSEYCE
jgi:hypothetical protein